MKFFDILQSLGGFAGIAAVLAVVPQLATIRKEVTHNHGSSIKDATARIETTINDLATRVEKNSLEVEKNSLELAHIAKTADITHEAINESIKTINHRLEQHHRENLAQRETLTELLQTHHTP